MRARMSLSVAIEKSHARLILPVVFFCIVTSLVDQRNVVEATYLDFSKTFQVCSLAQF